MVLDDILFERASYELHRQRFLEKKSQDLSLSYEKKVENSVIKHYLHYESGNVKSRENLGFTYTNSVYFQQLMKEQLLLRVLDLDKCFSLIEKPKVDTDIKIISKIRKICEISESLVLKDSSILLRDVAQLELEQQDALQLYLSLKN